MKELKAIDLKRANVPKRFWDVALSKIPEGLGYKDKLRNYLSNIEEAYEKGAGLYLWSEENSTGKTSAAVIVLKFMLRMRKTAYFEESWRLKNAVIRKEEIEEGYSIEDRVRHVDLLVLDDIGKEYRTDSGFAENTIEGIIRDRTQNLKITILTGNIVPNQIKKMYSEDLNEIFKETCVPVRVVGHDWRKEKAKEIYSIVEEGGG